MYKIIKDNKVIDVVKYADFIRFLPSGQVIRTEESLAEGIIGSDYRVIYSFGKTNDNVTCIVTAEKISLEEFNRLQSLLNSDQEVVNDQALLQTAINEAIDCLSKICKDKITSGFSIILSDQKLYNFKLTAEDQLTLLNLENQLNSGEAAFVYHATGLPCKVFFRDDMSKIIKTYRKHVLYHTTYFNTAKQYISSLTDINKIKSFRYGIDISGVVKNSTIRQILLDGGAD